MSGEFYGARIDVRAETPKRPDDEVCFTFGSLDDLNPAAPPGGGWELVNAGAHMRDSYDIRTWAAWRRRPDARPAS